MGCRRLGSNDQKDEEGRLGPDDDLPVCAFVRDVEIPLGKADGEWWTTEGPEGPIRIRFSEHNAFGVMDHYVDAGAGAEIYIPMRIVENGEGAEVLFTLFRQPGMSDEKFAADANWVEHDLRTLNGLIATL
jgi:hypothetical protein